MVDSSKQTSSFGTLTAPLQRQSRLVWCINTENSTAWDCAVHPHFYSLQKNSHIIFQSIFSFRWKQQSYSMIEHCSFSKWWHVTGCECFRTESTLRECKAWAYLSRQSFLISSPHCTWPFHKTKVFNIRATLIAFIPLKPGNFWGRELTCNLSPNESVWMTWVMSGFWGCAVALCVDTWKLPGT